MDMKLHFAAFALAAVLSFGASPPGHAEDAKPAETAAPAPANTDVARPSIASKNAEPAAAPAASEAEPRRHRRYARHHYRRYGYWEPFPVFLPHFHRHHISWARIRWFF
jgi:hypothetical protein